VANRTCERCGAKASPWIPRKRSNQGKMLCDGCTQVVAREREAVKTAATDPVEDRHPAGSATSDFGWDDDLAPEGVHPLMAPLPNSVWERFAKKQELRGKPLVPMASQIKINQRMRDRNGGGKTAARKTADIDLSHGAHQVFPGKKLVQHLQEAHGEPFAAAHIHGAGPNHHIELHNSGADHTHDEHGNVVPNAAHEHTKMSEKELDSHLQNHHNMTPGTVKTIKNMLGAGESMHSVHQKHHEDPVYSSLDTKPHEHPGEGHDNSPEIGGKKQLPHPIGMTSGGVKAHLLADHGMSQDEINNASDAASKNVMHNQVMHGLHQKAHSQGIGTDGHEHAENWDHKSFVHQDPNGVEEHLGHLKHAHGIGDEELAQKAEASGGDEGVHHQKLKELHFDLHDHDSGSYMKHGAPDHTHSGHADHGKPFVSTSGGTGEHLLHDHSMSEDDFYKITDNHPADSSAAIEKAHAALHAQHGADLDHQHVPTTKPGVKTPEKVAQEKLEQHFKEHHPDAHYVTKGDHNSLHDPEAYGYKAHPGHDHGPNGEVLHSLPTEKSGKPLTHSHASDMSEQQLKHHMEQEHNNDFLNTFETSHGDLLKQHAQEHVTGKSTHFAYEDGKIVPHSHAISQSGHDTFGRKLYGGDEPEPNAKIHPAVEGESNALAHIIQHHPNISKELYDTYKSNSNPQKSMQNFHAKLHASDNGLPKAPDGHEHAEAQGPPTQIPIGSHLVSHHGLSQEQVASMSPAEFKAHHEELHARHDEMDLGHGHVHPGGPTRKPIDCAINPHHAKMREDPDHPAVSEWYHGTGGSFSGPPKQATELMEDHGGWGNYGGGDWNNHAGTHWSSLHEMARDFNDGDNRVIHAKLHMRNPITYNSLNHMSHDAYDRLHASGDMKDGGQYVNNHSDDGGYNTCCSEALLHYAKGGHRNDGKYGMERYRDSLRASGHDGILVRNQADAPKGHWNAIPLHADQVEITHGSCHNDHGDERDNDVDEFNSNSKKLKEGWEHPKKFNPMDYTNGKPLPDADDVGAAHERKKQVPEPVHIREGRGERRGDANPYVNGRNLTENDSKGLGDDDEDDDDHYCEHCDEYGDHTSNNCDNKWCDVCDEHGDHTTEENHEECDHCGGYADHSTDEHEDEWGEHPDKIRKEGYCPHCEVSTKENYGQDKCVACENKLPDWGHLTAHGKAVKKGEYNAAGSLPDGTEVGPADSAPKSGKIYGPDLASHLYHHHHSDVGGKTFEDEDGDWDHSALEYHHAHLHSDPAWAKGQGFKTDHSHKELFGEYKSHDSMSPNEVHAHLMLSHAGHSSKAGYAAMSEIFGMSPDEAVKAHQKLHAADDSIAWGEKDLDGDLMGKLTHHHQLPADHPSNAPEGHSPTGEDLLDHFSKKHLNLVPSLKMTLKKNPKTAEALHQQMHDCSGPGTDPSNAKYHVHTPKQTKENEDKAAYLQHLQEHHGFEPTHHMHEQLQGMSAKELATHHVQEHNSMFPMGSDITHSHSDNNPHGQGWIKSEARKTSARFTLVDYFEEAAV
jgi:hypothetical protein